MRDAILFSRVCRYLESYAGKWEKWLNTSIVDRLFMKYPLLELQSA